MTSQKSHSSGFQSHAKQAKVFFALGHPRRLRILEALQNRPKGLTFEHIELLVHVRGASLSHHLRFLKDAKLINREIRDRFSIYTLNRAQLARIALPVGSPQERDKAA